MPRKTNQRICTDVLLHQERKKLRWQSMYNEACHCSHKSGNTVAKWRDRFLSNIRKIHAALVWASGHKEEKLGRRNAAKPHWSTEQVGHLQNVSQTSLYNGQPKPREALNRCETRDSMYRRCFARISGEFVRISLFQVGLNATKKRSPRRRKTNSHLPSRFTFLCNAQQASEWASPS